MGILAHLLHYTNKRLLLKNVKYAGISLCMIKYTLGIVCGDGKFSSCTIFEMDNCVRIF
jgi:hypothetical protein